MTKKVIVIGGGIVGLSTAYFLHQEGHQVTVFDKSSMKNGASYVNAGYLTPSHIVPLAAPGMITKGLKWMFDSSSPFYIKPRLDIDLMDWGLKFMRSCSKKHVQRSLKIIKDINVLSKELYHDFDALPQLDFHLEDRGVLMAFQTAAAEKAEGEVMREAKRLGLDVELIDRKQVHALQPEMDMNIAGAYLYRCDAHTTPGTFMEQLKTYLLKAGVQMHKETNVLQLLSSGKRIQTVSTDKGDFTADEVVIASGAWSQQLLKSVGINLPVQAGKGYRLNEEQPTGISMPAILMERKVAVTPMQGFTRFSGTMEIAGVNHTIQKNRVEAIAAAAASYYPGVSISQKTKEEVQCGLRPLSPDGLPFIGRHSAFDNLCLATGHSMMGWSLGPATGKLIAELVSDQKTSLDLTPFAAERTYG
ncbi:FAD-dependent oxidoreductase [Flavobacteriaceae bacterium]|nr:FAD-dependent oxidoreductase [Flavobacteriaceae bacterium]